MLFKDLNSFLLLVSALSLQIGAKPAPTLVKLPYGSFEGMESGRLVEFLGIPFAAPPLKELRFAPPTNPKSFNGVRQAMAFAPACPQQDVVFPGLPVQLPANVSEDCLYLNVIKPANISAWQKLPVVFYIYGGKTNPTRSFGLLGGFAIGDTSIFRGDTLVNRSIDLGAPVILVSAAYRVNAFGFLGGKEAKAAGIGNIGLRDQRFALKWVQKNIARFGGDPDKVTLWGDSAGSISIAMQMLLNDGNTEGLFHGAVMSSGSPIVLPTIENQQRNFDSLVADTDCSDSQDRLKCLRDAPFDKLMAGVNNLPTFMSFESLKLVWQPTVDGDTIVRDPLMSVQRGKFANIPFISGDVEDEGTVFSLVQTNITNNAQFLEYVKSNYFQEISDNDLKALEIAYPDDVTQGSPFNTGTAYVLSPQYKRLAAFQGDLAFQAPRRFFSAIASKRQPVYCYRYMNAPLVPRLGVLHGSDAFEFGAAANLTGFIASDALIYFTHNGDPNAPQDSISLLRNTKWDVYSSSVEDPLLFTFVIPPALVNITSDTYRAGPMKLLNKLSLNEIGRFGL